MLYCSEVAGICSGHISPGLSSSLSTTPRSVDIDPQPSKKRKKDKKGYDELDDMLIRNLKDIEERRDDEEELYTRQVAATLRRLTK